MTEQALIIGKAYTYFAIESDTLTEADYLHWLGMEPDAFGISGVKLSLASQVDFMAIYGYFFW